MDARKQTQHTLQLLREQLNSGSLRSATRMMQGLHPSEVAHLLESVPPDERAILWEMVDAADEGDILVELADEVSDSLIRGMHTERLIAATEGMEVDDLADLLADLPEAVAQQVLQSLDDHDRERIRQVLAYDEDSAGGLMNVDIVTVRPNVSLDVVARYLRAKGKIPDGTDSIFVVDRNDKYLGSLYLSRLVTADQEATVASVMSTDLLPIRADTPSADVVWEFEHRDLLSAAVVDENYRVVGRITIDDVVDEIRDEAEHSLMSAAGVDEEDDMFAPVFRSATRRALWLGIKRGTAFLAAAVVDQFQTALDKVVLLAVLMPVVPSMGGVAGSQSLIIITRGIALGQIDRGNASRILRKELLVGLLNGLGWAIVVAAATYIWFGDWQVGGVIAAALICNLFIAALAGFAIPLTLKRLHIDPALAGGVVLTTVTDVVGYAVFLGLGAAVLL
jgi:magnesium transporter